MGATFLRNNLNKRSVGLDLKSPTGPGALHRAGGAIRRGRRELQGRHDGSPRARLRDALAASWPELIYVSVSGFGNLGDSPYRTWPAYAMVPEAMSGLYEYSRQGDEPPRVIPAGALGDISSALFAVIGVQAALRQRDRTGSGPARRHRHAGLDARDGRRRHQLLVAGRTELRAAGDRRLVPFQGRLVRRCRSAREHQFEALAELVGRPDWLDRRATVQPHGLGGAHRGPDPSRHRGLGGGSNPARGLRRTGRRRTSRPARASPHPR